MSPTQTARDRRSGEAAMQGYITGKHVLLHPGAIIQGFGFRCWLRCLGALLSPRPTTFLAVACVAASRPRR
ncbi:MAG: hypothetical protein NDI82_02425 [Anaeromyxobacteraceae bacterium]|nr:hypothetical protein [Anaeromyxobacteraceae bacterium]